MIVDSSHNALRSPRGHCAFVVDRMSARMAGRLCATRRECALPVRVHTRPALSPVTTCRPLVRRIVAFPQLIGRIWRYRSNSRASVSFRRTSRCRPWAITTGKASFVYICEKIGSNRAVVYIDHRKAVVSLTAAFMICGIAAAFVYGQGQSLSDKQTVLANWLDGSIQVVVATSAFGLGVSVPDVRFVFRLGLPDTIEELVQEFGRAGRDGNPATAILHPVMCTITRVCFFRQVVRPISNRSCSTMCGTLPTRTSACAVLFCVSLVRRSRIVPSWVENSAPVVHIQHHKTTHPNCVLC